MALLNDLTTEVGGIFGGAWTIVDGRSIPQPSDLKLGNDGRKLDATILYADLADSTGLVNAYATEPQFPAEIYKAYLTCAAKIIKARGGQITAYDGDRIMGVFINDMKNNDAVRAGFQINGAVTNIINPQLTARYPNRSYKVQHSIGVDTSQVLVARIGVRNDNDLVWVGRSANFAAKLCALRDGDYATWITGDVYDKLTQSAKIFTDGRAMWEQRQWNAQDKMRIYRSNWWWSPDHNPVY